MIKDEKDLFVKKMLRLLLNEQMNERNHNGDPATMTIESKTFNQLLLYILMEESLLNDGSGEVHEKIQEQLDAMIEESEREFEEVLSMLSKKS